jgi:putative transposase
MSTTKRQKRTRPRAAVNKVTTSYRVSDALWAVMAAVVPEHQNTHRLGGGRPRVPDRQCADAIFYVLRTGCQWGA